MCDLFDRAPALPVLRGCADSQQAAADRNARTQAAETRSLTGFRSVVLLGIVVLAGCADTTDSTYRDLQAVRASGVIDQGWIPEWIPVSAVELYESHDADSGESMLTARYDENEPIEWSEACEQVSPFEPPQPPFRRKWWPSDVPASRWSAPRHVFLRCGDYAFAAFGEGRFYYWRRDANL